MGGGKGGGKSKGGYAGGGGGYAGGGGGYAGGGGGYAGKGGYAAGGGGARLEETIDVDDRDIGKIIGRGGMNIRDLQDGTGCRIITPQRKADNEEPGMRQVRLAGTKEQIAKCKDAIDGVLMGEEPKDVLAEIEGAAIKKNIDSMSMGHLAKIKDKLETEWAVVIELDARSARIWSKAGDQDKAKACKEAIEEELDDLTAVDTLTVPVPGNIVNQVINDPALRQLQDQTGVTANVCKGDEGTGIRLTGLSGAIQEAKRLIERRNAGEGAEFLSLVPGLFSRMSPKMMNDFHRDIGILMQNSGAQIDIAEGSNKADFQGGPDEVRYAKGELQKILHFYLPQECEVIELPPESVDWIAGTDDRELMNLQSGGAVVSLDRGAATMWLCGNPKSLERARNRIHNSLKRWDREHTSMQLQSKGQCLAIIGSGGSTIRELQSSTGARIDVDINNLHVMISGKEECVADARKRISQLIGGAGKGKGGGYREDDGGGKGWGGQQDWDNDRGGKAGAKGGGKGRRDGFREDGGGGMGYDGGPGRGSAQDFQAEASSSGNAYAPSYAAPTPGLDRAGSSASGSDTVQAPRRPGGRGRGASRW